MSQRQRRIQSTIGEIDDKLGGGIPPGALVTCETDSQLQTETFLHQLCKNTRTLYLSTVANTEAATAEFQKSPVSVDLNTIQIEHISPGGELQQIITKIENTPEKSLTVIDCINMFENGNHTSREDLNKFLNWAQNRCRRTEGAIVFTRYDSQNNSGHIHQTNSISDIIIMFERCMESGEVNTYVEIPKCRSSENQIMREKVDTHGIISVDSTRDIA